MTEQAFDHDYAAAAPATRKRRSFALSGRGDRKEYWGAIAAMMGVGFILGLIGLENASSGTGLVGMWIMIRRLHDINRTGWWSLAIAFGPLVPMLAMIAFVPMTVLIPFVVLLSCVWTAWLGAIPGDPHDNRFGPPPGGPDLKEVFS